MELSDADTGKRRLGNPETERKWTLCIYLQWKKPFEYTKSKIIGDWICGVVASCGAHIDFHKETVYQVLLTERQVTHALSVLKEYHMPGRVRRTGVCVCE